MKIDDRDEYSCMLWKGEEGELTRILRQTFILSTECSKQQYWAAFIKHKLVRTSLTPDTLLESILD